MLNLIYEVEIEVIAPVVVPLTEARLSRFDISGVGEN
jgi:hypothetical protein